MTRSLKLRVALFATLVAWAGSTIAETPVGSNIDSRLILAFEGTDDWAASRLPEGWRSFAFPAGPLKGATTALVLIDRHVALDPAGKPLNPASTYSSAIVALATHADHEGARLFVLRQYESGIEGGAYGTSIPASIERREMLAGGSTKSRTRNEVWRFEPETGGSLTIEAQYEVGISAWSPGEMRPFSAMDPQFHRIYRYNQLTDVVMSAGLGKALTGTVSIESSIAELDSHFDGSETLIAMLSIPVYVRDVSLP